jgi:carbonic anhydrase
LARIAALPYRAKVVLDEVAPKTAVKGRRQRLSANVIALLQTDRYDESLVANGAEQADRKQPMDGLERRIKTMQSQPFDSLDLSRRGTLLVAAVGLLTAASAHAADSVADVSVPPEVAMARLRAGNARFVAGRAEHPRQDRQRRLAVAGDQHPFATILTCSDSRLAPEVIFDQGLGDLFVARVAGNVVDDEILASIEYSVIHLGSTLVMVLGHDRCGAVKATIDALDGRGSDEDKDTKIGSLAALITPAVKAVPASTPDKLDAAITLNAENSATAIFAESPPLKARVLSGKLKIVAARYNLSDGRVALTSLA